RWWRPRWGEERGPTWGWACSARFPRGPPARGGCSRTWSAVRAAVDRLGTDLEAPHLCVRSGCARRKGEGLPGVSSMAELAFLVNELCERDPRLARRFEDTVRQAAAEMEPGERLHCFVFLDP